MKRYEETILINANESLEVDSIHIFFSSWCIASIPFSFSNGGQKLNFLNKGFYKTKFWGRYIFYNGYEIGLTVL